MAQVADLLRGIAAATWVLLAFVIFLALRSAIAGRMPSLTRLGLGASGVSMEFAETRLEQATSGPDTPTVGEVARRGVINRLQRNADLLRRARIIWVDDHPENNVPILELLRQFGARVDTPRTNSIALEMLKSTSYDVVISDVARDSEGPQSELKGVELAEAIYRNWGRRTLLFTARFDPTTLPGADTEARLRLARMINETVFGRTNRYDEALHLILDSLERQML